MATILGTSAPVKWRLSGTVTPPGGSPLAIDVTFGVPNTYQWSRHYDAARLQDPNSGKYTLMLSTDGTVHPRFGQPVLQLDGPNRAAAAAQLDQAFALGGPFTLATPTATLTVSCDPSAGDGQWANAGAYLTQTVGFFEV